MKNNPITFSVCIMLAGSVFAGAEPLDCQTSSKLEQNLDEINAVTKKVNDECPKPTKDQFLNVCQGIYNRQPSGKPSVPYTYQDHLWKISCASPDKDSIEVAKEKIQKMWNQYRQDFQCPGYVTSYASGKNVTKFAMDMGYSGFLMEAVKKYKLDMNFKDPEDQKTILDFVKDRKEYFQNSPPIDTLKVAEYERIYKYLEANGAKHAKDL